MRNRPYNTLFSLSIIIFFANMVVTAGCGYQDREKEKYFYEEGLAIPFFQDLVTKSISVDDWKDQTLVLKHIVEPHSSFALCTFDNLTQDYEEYIIDIPMGYGNASLMPDGSRVIFPAIGNNQQIYSYDLHTGQTSKITDGYAPSLSADGKHLVFFWENESRIINLETGVGQYLMEIDSFFVAPKISPSGEYVALFNLSKANHQSVLYMINLEDNTNFIFNLDEEGGHFSWSPDSRMLAYLQYGSGYACINFLDVNQLCDVGRVCGNDAMADFYWSPDGKYLVYKFGEWYGLDVQKLRDEGYLGENCIVK